MNVHPGSEFCLLTRCFVFFAVPFSPPCSPVYKTQRRGDSYVFTAGLRTKAPSTKWCLAGVVLVMEVEE
jgi:hypothetical protein